MKRYKRKHLFVTYMYIGNNGNLIKGNVTAIVNGGDKITNKDILDVEEHLSHTVGRKVLIDNYKIR